MILLSCQAAIEMADGSKSGLALRALLRPSEMVVAPDALQAQATQQLAALVGSGRLTEARARQILWCIDGLTERSIPANAYAAEALSLALERNISAADALDVLMARDLPATLFTLSEPAQNLCTELGVNCTQSVQL